MNKQYNVRQVAKILDLTEYTVRIKLREGIIPGYKVGGVGGWRVDEDDLKAYIEGLRRG